MSSLVGLYKGGFLYFGRNDGVLYYWMLHNNMHYVYILASVTKTLYIGVTNNVAKRVYEHKQGFVPGFTKQYNVDRLVYLEEYESQRDAISREKQLKNWRREKKEFLINSVNPAWDDLSERL